MESSADLQSVQSIWSMLSPFGPVTIFHPCPVEVKESLCGKLLKLLSKIEIHEKYETLLSAKKAHNSENIWKLKL